MMLLFIGVLLVGSPMKQSQDSAYFATTDATLAALKQQMKII